MVMESFGDKQGREIPSRPPLAPDSLSSPKVLQSPFALEMNSNKLSPSNRRDSSPSNPPSFSTEHKPASSIQHSRTTSKSKSGQPQITLEPSLSNTSASKCFVDYIPDEVLVHVFSSLEPEAIKIASATCRRWRAVISDEQCWRSAFSNYFKALPLKRISPTSWRNEYLTRVRLAKDWNRGRYAVQFDPRVGSIDEMYIDELEGRMYVGSLEKGAVTICHPATGKIERDSIHFSDDNEPLEIGAVKIDKYRIAVGYMTGNVSLITNFREKSSFSTRRLRGAHDGAVTCINWLAGNVGILATGGFDGDVRVWDVSAALCIRILGGDGSPITHLGLDEHKFVVGSTRSGECLVWEADLKSLIPKAIHSMHKRQAASAVSTYEEPQRLLFQSSLRVANDMLFGFVYEGESRHLATGVSDFETTSSIMLWNIDSCSQRFKLVGHEVATVLKWDLPEAGSGGKAASLLIAGDLTGSLFIWSIPDLSQKHDAVIALSPIRTFFKPHEAPISSLIFDAHKIISASRDGKIQVMDSMSGKVIRYLAFKQTRSPWHRVEGEERVAVRHIWSSATSVVTCMGNSIKYWSFDSENTSNGTPKKKKKGKLIMRAGGSSSGSRLFSNQERYIKQQECESDLKTSLQHVRDDMEAERQRIVSLREQREIYNGNDVLGSNATEEELMSYAMMLSIAQHEEEEASRHFGDTMKIGSTGSAPRGSSPIGSVSSQLNSNRRPSTSSLGSWRKYNPNSQSGSLPRDEWMDEEDEDDDFPISPDAEMTRYISPSSISSRSAEANDIDLSTSAGRRRIVFGSTAATGRGSKTEDSIRASNTAASLMLMHSPRLQPALPSQPIRRQSQGNVIVTARPSQLEEDDELQYVLELSMHEK